MSGRSKPTKKQLEVLRALREGGEIEVFDGGGKEWTVHLLDDDNNVKWILREVTWLRLYDHGWIKKVKDKMKYVISERGKLALRAADYPYLRVVKHD